MYSENPLHLSSTATFRWLDPRSSPLASITGSHHQDSDQRANHKKWNCTQTQITTLLRVGYEPVTL